MVKKRKYGSGTVRKRSDGRWEARVVVGYDDSGNPKTKKRSCQRLLIIDRSSYP